MTVPTSTRPHLSSKAGVRVTYDARTDPHTSPRQRVFIAMTGPKGNVEITRPGQRPSWAR